METTAALPTIYTTSVFFPPTLIPQLQLTGENSLPISSPATGKLPWKSSILCENLSTAGPHLHQLPSSLQLRQPLQLLSVTPLWHNLMHHGLSTGLCSSTSTVRMGILSFLTLSCPLPISTPSRLHVRGYYGISLPQPSFPVMPLRLHKILHGHPLSHPACALPCGRL